ncbi:PepSY domain-containing protein [Oxalobacteraceae bacterium]|nr:PepSY domain-containing protein [Oxalobacteraceae bacterium]
MKAHTLRSYMALHTWVGLASGFMLFIAFFAGSITVFHEELHTWERPASTQATMQSAALAQPLIDAVLRAHPEAKKEFSLRFPSSHQPALRLEWHQPDAAGKLHERVFYLSRQGALEEVRDASALSELVHRLHYTAGLPASWGIYVLGVVSILYGVALVSGVVLYAPVFLRDLFALRIGKNLKRMWQDAHNIIGVLSLPFHVMYAWSGAILGLGLLLMAPFQLLVFDGKLLALVGPDISLNNNVQVAHVAGPLLPASRLIAAIEGAAPGIALQAMHYRDVGDIHAQVDAYGQLRQGSVSGMAAVAINAHDASIGRVITPQSASPGTTFLRGLYALHYAQLGELVVKWMYFGLGMAGAFLFYSGNLLWIEKRRKQRLAAQPRSGRLMAQATLGVCLGSMAGIGAAFLINKLLPAATADLAGWEERAYYAVFLLALAWAFVRPPARAAHELLMACAALALLLPLAQWWRGGVDPLQSAWAGEWVIVGVDAVALVFGLLYWRLARAVLRRGLHGDPHSVWSLESPSVTAALRRAA